MEKLTPQKAKEILKRKGMSVTLEQAEKILEFLRKFSKIIVEDFRRKK